ncbi:MAG TPA: hypothetical protein VEL11_13815 [Candidatus Bathyarchaeia archaeon]|nr:hypothetical protein [Candidatus Bathyarchaeia archaeon]
MIGLSNYRMGSCVCGSHLLVTIPDCGEIVCEHCGAVISYKTEVRGPEWTYFTSKAREGNDESRART